MKQHPNMKKLNEKIDDYSATSSLSKRLRAKTNKNNVFTNSTDMLKYVLPFLKIFNTIKA